MNSNTPYHQNKQDQLNAYRADLGKLKVLASRTNETVQKEMRQHFSWIVFLIDEINSILIDFQKANGKTWLSIQIGIESALATLQDSMNDANAELNHEMVSGRGV